MRGHTKGDAGKGRSSESQPLGFERAVEAPELVLIFGLATACKHQHCCGAFHCAINGLLIAFHVVSLR